MQSNILIEPIINGIPHGYIIQAEKFSLALRITNIDNKPTKAFVISNVLMQSSEGHSISEDFGKKEFNVQILNPNESNIIEIGENGQFMYGLVHLVVNIKVEQGEVFNFNQKNSFTGEITKIGENRWVDFIYIKSANQFSQEKMSTRIYWLTWITATFAFIQIVPILFRIYKYFN